MLLHELMRLYIKISDTQEIVYIIRSHSDTPQINVMVNQIDALLNTLRYLIKHNC